MFEKITPEQAGISSANVADFISVLERRGLATHSVLMMKGTDIFAEYYWTPFHRDFSHRMYSETKSYASIAIGLLEEDGLIDLDKPIADYFPEKIDTELHPYRAKQTVRDMLRMHTAGDTPFWFTHPDPDRTHLYMNTLGNARRAGTYWEYDSAGSQVLGALAEKISGKSLFDFLTERVFSKLGTFKNATILKTQNGDSWADSALICTPRDMASFGRFVLNYGKWNGEQLLNERYLREATSPLVCNLETGWVGPFGHGYGYQIWCTEQDGFAFNGMGCQFMVMHPTTDTVFVITSDNQGYPAAKEIIVNTYFDYIVTPMQKNALPADPSAEKKLAEQTADLKLRVATGATTHPNAEKLNGKVFTCSESRSGIKQFSLHFNGDEGEFRYTNAQGDKVLPFGIGKNVFCKFPELGYSDGVGGERTTNGFMYDAAVSAAWQTDGKLMLICQIIDRYFGNFCAIFGFVDNEVTVRMVKTAEDFLGAYQGMLRGTCEEL